MLVLSKEHRFVGQWKVADVSFGLVHVYLWLLLIRIADVRTENVVFKLGLSLVLVSSCVVDLASILKLVLDPFELVAGVELVSVLLSGINELSLNLSW